MKKRFWTLFAVALLCCTVFAVSVNAAQTAKGEVLAGTPTIDGKLDPIYRNSLTIKSGDYAMQVIAGHNEGWDMSMTATTYALYDESYLYLCSVVKDNDVVSPSDAYMAGTNPYKMDGVEYRLCVTSGNIVKVSVDAFGKRCFGLASHEKLFDYSSILYKTTQTGDGFVIEVAIPRTGIFAMPANGAFGIKVQLADMTAAAAGTTPIEKTNFFSWLPTVDGTEGITAPVAYPVSTNVSVIPKGQTASGKVQSGTPAIDGRLDAVYMNSLTIQSGDYPMAVIAGHNEGWDMSMTATTYALYDESYLYLCSVVKDDDVVSPSNAYMAGTNPYKMDGVEYRLCMTSGNTVKVSVDAFGKRCFGLSSHEKLFDYSSILYKTALTADGYVIELAIPRTGIFAMPATGPFGIKVQLADMTAAAAGTTPLEKTNFFSWLPTEDAAEGITSPVAYEIASVQFPISGTSGAIHWTLTEDGILTISGGAMTAAPWLAYADHIKKINITSGVTEISRAAFQNCSKAVSVSIPETVTAIGAFAFANCASLETINIPASVTSIGGSAFTMMNPAASKLSGIYVHADNQYYSSDANGVLYNKDKTVLIKCPVAYTGDADFKIPGTVVSVFGSAFRGCSLTGVVIPASVTELGELVFVDNILLEKVTVHNPALVFGEDVFQNCTNPNLMIYGYNGSTAQTYAQTAGLAFTSLGDIPTVGDAFVFIDAPAFVAPGTSITYTVSLAGTYDGFSFDVISANGITVKSVTASETGAANVDALIGGFRVSVEGGLEKADAAKEVIVTVEAEIAQDAVPGKMEIALAEVKISAENGGPANIHLNNATVEIVEHVPGDVNGDGTFDYYDVSKLYAFHRGKDVPAAGTVTDINGDGTFDYYDVSCLYAIFRGKASF